MNNKSIMNKIILLLFGLVLFYGMNATNANAQIMAVAQASAIIIDPSNNAAQVNFVNSFSQIVSNNSNAISGKPIILPAENGKLMSSTIQNVASFSITSENKNSFSVSLPSHTVILKNTKNANTLQVDGWQSSAQPGKGEFQKNIWVVNLGASLKMVSDNDNAAGVYSGTYPVTFVYN